MRLRGLPYYTHSTLYAVIEHVRRAARLDRHDSPETALDKLERVVQGSRLPRLWQQQGKPAEARELLPPAHEALISQWGGPPPERFIKRICP